MLAADCGRSLSHTAVRSASSGSRSAIRIDAGAQASGNLRAASRACASSGRRRRSRRSPLSFSLRPTSFATFAPPRARTPAARTRAPRRSGSGRRGLRSRPPRASARCRPRCAPARAPPSASPASPPDSGARPRRLRSPHVRATSSAACSSATRCAGSRTRSRTRAVSSSLGRHHRGRRSGSRHTVALRVPPANSQHAHRVQRRPRSFMLVQTNATDCPR
jgi:hypothetical protein